MHIDYTEKGKFVAETSRLADKLDADAVMIFVFGSKKGSGCCCEMRCDEADLARLGRCIIESMRGMADAMERDIENRRSPYANRD